MRLLVTGASGFIGSALVPSLEARGHQVVRMVRRAPRGPGEIAWAPHAGPLDPLALAGFDGVVHLSGATIAQRWTGAVRRRIRSSRVDTTARLATAIAACDRPPRVMLVSSAIGIYGDRGDAWVDESSPPGEGFLAELGVAWEAAADPARAAGVRVVHGRTGIVLDRRGGALERLLPPFRLGLGGPIADGRAWWSWITRDDLLGAMAFALEREEVSGPLNLVAPGPVRNAELTRVLARALHRPAWFRVPAFALRLVFGGMADEALLASTRVRPAGLERAGFPFAHPTIEAGVEAALRGS